MSGHFLGERTLAVITKLDTVEGERNLVPLLTGEHFEQNLLGLPIGVYNRKGTDKKEFVRTTL